jgi:phosphoribosylaminoimidazole (AIR) synthetase
MLALILGQAKTVDKIKGYAKSTFNKAFLQISVFGAFMNPILPGFQIQFWFNVDGVGTKKITSDMDNTIRLDKI